MTVIERMYLVDQSNRAHRYNCKQLTCSMNLQLPILFFAKSIIPDMHHRITDMYINFQQKWVSRSVKTVRTNIFAKKLQVA